jgi:hypothetical protein
MYLIRFLFNSKFAVSTEFIELKQVQTISPKTIKDYNFERPVFFTQCVPIVNVQREYWKTEFEPEYLKAVLDENNADGIGKMIMEDKKKR